MQVFVVLKSGMYKAGDSTSQQTAVIAVRSTQAAADQLAAKPVNDPAWVGACKVWVDTDFVDGEPFWG